ncbi:hypothetical protein BGX28_004417 [Mortierella sp. GBA30]|nr:hypothetical protein BGX28_004417 [Mortierella sp. GBA30]
MKFVCTAAFVGAFSLLLTFAPCSVQACERECQVNVTRAFADKYQELSSIYYTLLSQKVDETLFYGIPIDTVLEPVGSKDAVKLIQDSVTRAENAWDVTIFQTVFDTIFKDEPKFKGDCNQPHRVNQPPRGVNWTISDCHNMDYICGNPPSICHFMPMIKTRIRNKMISLLQSRVSGDDSDVYINFLGPALQTLLMKEPKLVNYTAKLHGNLNQVLATIKTELEKFADEDQWKQDWDLEIKILLLTFP